MRGVVIVILLVILLFMAFKMGRRWEVMLIADGLRETGQVVTQWGNTKIVKITGTVEDIETL